MWCLVKRRVVCAECTICPCQLFWEWYTPKRTLYVSQSSGWLVCVQRCVAEMATGDLLWVYVYGGFSFCQFHFYPFLYKQHWHHANLSAWPKQIKPLFISSLFTPSCRESNSPRVLLFFGNWGIFTLLTLTPQKSP